MSTAQTLQYLGKKAPPVRLKSTFRGLDHNKRIDCHSLIAALLLTKKRFDIKEDKESPEVFGKDR